MSARVGDELTTDVSGRQQQVLTELEEVKPCGQLYPCSPFLLQFFDDVLDCRELWYSCECSRSTVGIQ